jgi:hypothetical protein
MICSERLDHQDAELTPCFSMLPALLNNRGVRDQVQTGRLVELIFRGTFANLRLIRDEQVTPQRAQSLAFVEL